MMFSKVFGIATLALATFANVSPLTRREVSVDPAKWYTLLWDGMQFLGSTEGILMIQQHEHFDDLNSGIDKGVHFCFPDNLPGADSTRDPRCCPSPSKLVCEAHSDHFVGLAERQTPEIKQYNTYQSEERAATIEAGDKAYSSTWKTRSCIRRVMYCDAKT